MLTVNTQRTVMFLDEPRTPNTPFIQRLRTIIYPESRYSEVVAQLTEGPALLLDVFASVPHVMVCVKDSRGRYVAANDAFVQRTTKRTSRDVVGKRARDLFPKDLAISYEAQDRSVLETGKEVRNQLEIISDRARERSWYLTTKVLHATSRGPYIVVVSSPAALPRRGTALGDGLRAAVTLAQTEFASNIRVTDLARVANMSTDRLERAMFRVLAVSPKQFLLRLRLEHGAALLTTTSAPIADVALASGFYDQPQFTRQFKDTTGLTPGAYRALGNAGR